MKHNKITFNTVDKKSKRVGVIICDVFDGRAVYRFDNAEQLNITFEKMKKDGLKVILSRGMILQIFHAKKIKEISKILKDDAYKGAESTIGSKAEITIENWNEELLE